MSERDDAGFDAIERRLTGRPGRAVPPGHRDRVLAAVRDTLAEKVPATKSGQSPQAEKVPATKSGQSPQGDYPVSPDLVAGTFIALVAMALSAALVIVAPWVAMTRSAAPVSMEPRIVARARAAGIDLPGAVVAVPIAPSRETSSRGGLTDVLEARRHEAWRMRTLLEGEL